MGGFGPPPEESSNQAPQAQVPKKPMPFMSRFTPPSRPQGSGGVSQGGFGAPPS